MMGASATALPLLRAPAARPMRKKAGPHRVPARHRQRAAPTARWQVRTTGNQGSGVLRSMVQANGLIVLRHDQGKVAAGDEVDVMMFDGAI